MVCTFFILQMIQEKGDYSRIDKIGEHGTDAGSLYHIQFNTCHKINNFPDAKIHIFY